MIIISISACISAIIIVLYATRHIIWYFQKQKTNIYTKNIINTELILNDNNNHLIAAEQNLQDLIHKQIKQQQSFVYFTQMNQDQIVTEIIILEKISLEQLQLKKIQKRKIVEEQIFNIEIQRFLQSYKLQDNILYEQNLQEFLNNLSK